MRYPGDLPYDGEIAVLATAPICVSTSAVIVGPYWFGVDDSREDRPGTLLNRALPARDVSYR